MDKDNQLPALDKELLNGYLQTLGRGVIKKMLALYCQQSSLYLADIQQALACDDLKAWQESCHKMKGAAGSVGLTLLHARLATMEKFTGDATEKAQQLAELNTQNSEAIAVFNHWLDTID